MDRTRNRYRLCLTLVWLVLCQHQLRNIKVKQIFLPGVGICHMVPYVLQICKLDSTELLQLAVFRIRNVLTWTRIRGSVPPNR